MGNLFANLVGNQAAYLQLSTLVENGSFPNSMMLRGPRGVGKFTAANQFARFANCTGSRTVDCRCESCQRFALRVSPNCLAYPTKVSKATIS